jgi:hypothetical protein
LSINILQNIENYWKYVLKKRLFCVKNMHLINHSLQKYSPWFGIYLFGLSWFGLLFILQRHIFCWSWLGWSCVCVLVLSWIDYIVTTFLVFECLSSMYSSLCSSSMYSYYSVLKHCAHIRCTHIVCTYIIRCAHVY